MKKPPTKRDLRAHLQRQTEAFLTSGGKIREFKVGDSAYDKGKTPATTPLFQTSRVTRTPVNDVIDALEARREQKKLKAKVVGRRTPRRRKKIVYDDFGEPLRVIWVED